MASHTNPDALIQKAVKGLLDVLADYQIHEALRLDAAKHAIDALRNVMSVSDATRLGEEIRRLRGD